MPSDWARALAAATPTRSPVKSPGPTSTATAPRSPGTRATWRSRCSSAGVRVSTWRRRPVSANSASTPAGVRTATPTVSVAVSMATTAGTRSPGPGPRRPPPTRPSALTPRSVRARPPPRRPGAPSSPVRRSRLAPRRRARRVGGDEGDLECALAEDGDGEVAPLDEGDGILFHQLGQGEIGDFGHRGSAVDVGVDELGDGSVGPAAVMTHQRERRAGHRACHTERGRKALGEDGLAGAEVAHEEHDVAGPAQAGDAAGQLPGLRGRAPWRAAGASSRARRRHEPLGPHEVRPHLGHGLAPGPQHIGRVVRGHEGGTASLEDLAAQLADAPRALEQELGGEVPRA